MFISQYCGDPRTPGYPSLAPDTPAVPKEDWPLPSVPVQPLSAADATPLMLALASGSGVMAPESFQGGLGFRYQILGEMPVRVRLVVRMRFFVGPIWNVVARCGPCDALRR